MKPGDRAIVTDPRAGAFYGDQVRILELGDNRAKVAAKGRRPCELPLRWLAPVEEVGSNAVPPQASTPLEPVFAEFGVAPRNSEPLNGQGSEVGSSSLEGPDLIIRGGTPKEILEEFGSSARNSEPLNGQGSEVGSSSLEGPDLIIRGGTPKEILEEFGVAPRNSEPLNTTDLVEALSTLRDRLRAKGTLPGWIEQDRKGERAYHRYRWYEDGKQPQRAIAAKDLAGYRERVRRGQMVSHAEALIKLLEEEF